MYLCNVLFPWSHCNDDGIPMINVLFTDVYVGRLAAMGRQSRSYKECYLLYIYGYLK